MPPRTRQERRSPAPTEVANRLHSASIHLLRRLRVEDQVTGLTGPRLSALSVAVFAGPITLSDLARAEQVRPPTMSRLVAGLVRLGLVVATQAPDDRRVRLIRATPRGKAVLEAGRTRRVQRLTRDLERLGARDYATLTSALRVLDVLARPE